LIQLLGWQRNSTATGRERTPGSADMDTPLHAPTLPEMPGIRSLPVAVLKIVLEEAYDSDRRAALERQTC